MNKRNVLPGALSALLLLLLLLLSVVSWVVAAMGGEVHSILCAEGFRWISLHAQESILSPVVGYAVSVAFVLGCVQECGVMRIWHASRIPFDERLGVFVSAFVLLLLFAGVIVPVFKVDSALRSVTGGLFPSPWLTGLPFVLPAITFVAALSFALFARRERPLDMLCTLLTAGLSRYAIWLVNVALLCVLMQISRYVFII